MLYDSSILSRYNRRTRSLFLIFFFFFFQAEDGIRDAQESRGLGDVYKRQVNPSCFVESDSTASMAGGLQRAWPPHSLASEREGQPGDDAPQEPSNATVTIFDKILSKEIPSTCVYEDDQAFAFRDISPTAPTHILVIPKVKDGLDHLSDARPDQKAKLGHLMFVAGEIGKTECPGGFRIVVNNGDDGLQSVDHLHLHVIGGKKLSWPPGCE
eukprot:TRINITY_DN558_c0_g1_i3.p1 TRINITY_DN558_c0_g1~~TRINITY_DN558_c0_g1_i3.p1  ORF type:complete len:212 (-),score=39.84 TRINITY_DN558_c0_g1_i3:376-1011(-)